MNGVLTGGLPSVQFGRWMSSSGWTKGVNKRNLASVVDWLSGGRRERRDRVAPLREGK
jgi:hypothetical protein